jgi:hypothetical protein
LQLVRCVAEATGPSDLAKILREINRPFREPIGQLDSRGKIKSRNDCNLKTRRRDEEGRRRKCFTTSDLVFGFLGDKLLGIG